MKYCVSTLGSPEWGMDEFLSLAAEFSLDGLELRFLNNSLGTAAELEKYLASPENARRFAASGIAIPVLGTSFHLCEADTEAMTAFQATARAADALGIRRLRVFDGPVWGKTLDDGRLTKARENFAAWKKWRADNGITAEMAIETHGASSSTVVLEELFCAIGGHLPVVWAEKATRASSPSNGSRNGTSASLPCAMRSAGWR